MSSAINLWIGKVGQGRYVGVRHKAENRKMILQRGRKRRAEEGRKKITGGKKERERGKAGGKEERKREGRREGMKKING